MSETIVPIRSSTQLFTEIADIRDDIAIFADGSAVMVVSTSAVNFGLLSVAEQDAIIYAYAGLLNSLSFPVEIFIQTKHKDISAYIKLLEDQEKRQKNPKLAKSIHGYRLFVASMVKEKEVLDKKFYIAIPFSNLELGGATPVALGQKRKGLPYSLEYISEKALVVLTPKKDQILRLLARVGLRATQLTTEQLAKLYFTLYNPGTPIPESSVFETIKKGRKT